VTTTVRSPVRSPSTASADHPGLPPLAVGPVVAVAAGFFALNLALELYFLACAARPSGPGVSERSVPTITASQLHLAVATDATSFEPTWITSGPLQLVPLVAAVRVPAITLPSLVFPTQSMTPGARPLQ
jgi:hypothetical protein